MSKILIDRSAVLDLIQECAKKDRNRPISNLANLILQICDLPEEPSYIEGFKDGMVIVQKVYSLNYDESKWLLEKLKGDSNG